MIHNGALADLVESFKRTVLRLEIARLQTAEKLRALFIVTHSLL